MGESAGATNAVTGGRLKRSWARFWMRFAHRSLVGRHAARLAGLATRPYYGRLALAAMHPEGYVAPSAVIAHGDFRSGRHCYLGDRVLIYQDVAGGAGGRVRLGAGVHLHQDVIVQCGRGAKVQIGARAHIQPRCVLSAYGEGDLTIGERVEIAAHCGFFTYNHGVAADRPIREQPTVSKGGIVLEDDVWLGFGVVVLDGVRIGRGAVVGAGAVVAQDLPAYSIAVGVPARVVGTRPGASPLAEAPRVMSQD